MAFRGDCGKRNKIHRLIYEWMAEVASIANRK
jgi:hypothetical protein